MKAYLSTCLLRNLDAGTAFSIAQTLMLSEPQFTWGMNFDALIDRVRSQQATYFLNNPSLGEVMLFVDDDIQFYPRDAAKLVQQTREVSCAAYATRSGTIPHVAIRLLPGKPFKYSPDAPPLEICYASTGFMAIHRNVLAKLAESLPVLNSGVEAIIPFFTPFGYMGEYLSEDWAFCQRARDAGFRIWTDPSIRLAHMGSRAYILEDATLSALDQTVSFTVKEGQIDRTDIISDLAAFLNKPIAETIELLRTTNATQQLADEWNTTNPQTPEQVTHFYHSTSNYIYDLTLFNLSSNYWWRIFPTRQIVGKHIVDFGGGIGTLSLLLASSNKDVTYVDIPSPHRNFAEFRFQRHGFPVTVTDTLKGLTNQDIVLAIDTLEHIHPSLITETAQDIYNCLVPNGYLLAVSDFGTRSTHPMHYSTSSQFDEALTNAGFIKKNNRYYKEVK